MNLKFNYILICFIVCYSASLLAQDKTIDSLKLALKSAKHDIDRCNTLNALIEAESDFNVWIPYNNQLQKLVSKNLESISKNDSTYKIYLKYLAATYDNIGFLAGETGEISKALEYNYKSLKIEEETGNKSGISKSLNNIGGNYYKQGNIEKALECFTKSLKISESLNDYFSISRLLNNIGGIYFQQNEFPKALEFYNKCLLVNMLTKDVSGMSYALNNLGNLYNESNDANKALDYFKKSLKLREDLGDKRGIAESMSNVGHVYYIQNKVEDAINLYKKSLKIQEEIDDKDGMSYTYNNIAEVYLKQKNYNKALEYCLRALKICKDLGYPESIRFSAQQLNQVYKAKGDYKNALQNYELYIQMNDSVINNENRKASLLSQLKYEYEKKAAADSVTVVEEKKITAVQFKQEKNQRYFLYAGLGLTLFFGGFMFNRFRVAKKQKKIIESQKMIVEEQKLVVEEKQREVLDSIRYAKRIQQSLLPNDNYLKKYIPYN